MFLMYLLILIVKMAVEVFIIFWFDWVSIIIFLCLDVALNEFECPCVHVHVCAL